MDNDNKKNRILEREIKVDKRIDKKEENQEDHESKRFLNGWSKEQERLMAEWSDIATCYRWLHDQSEKIFHSKTLWINLPVIILSTVGGTANFGVQSLFDSDNSKKYASFLIGSISLLAGLLTTVGNYLRYAQLEESHRVASIAWGKFQRLIAIELALNPNDRMDSMDFLKICRSDLDRLIEQSPPIPKEAIELFEGRFGTIKELKKPDICGALEHTHVFENSEARLKQLAIEAALMLRHKKNTLNELVMPSIKEKIREEVKIEIKEILEKNKSPREPEKVDEKLKNKMKFEERLQYGKYQTPLSPTKMVESVIKRAATISAIPDSKTELGKGGGNEILKLNLGSVKMENEIVNPKREVEMEKFEVNRDGDPNDHGDMSDQMSESSQSSQMSHTDQKSDEERSNGENQFDKPVKKKKSVREIYQKKIEKDRDLNILSDTI